MTRSVFTLSFFLLLTLSISAQESSLVYPEFERYENFEDVYLAPEGRGYAVGSCNVLYVTTDDGANWATMDSPPNTGRIYTVQCEPGTNCATVYLATNRGTLRSTDRGSNWAEVSNKLMFEMDFSQPGVIYGYRLIQNEFYRSTDDGLTWTTVSLPAQTRDHIFFNSPTSFAMIGDSSFFRSMDGGANWTKTNQFPKQTALATLDSDGNYYIETFGNDIYKSSDGGLTWIQKAETAHQYGVYYDMFKDSEDSLHIISFNGFRFSSGDDGVTWTPVYNFRFRSYNKFRRVEGRLLAAGDGLTILKGNEDYSDMVSLFGEDYPQFREIVFHDTNTGYAFGEEGEIFRTTNGGDSWSMTGQIDSWVENRPKVGPDGSIYGIRNFNDFIRSTNGGQTWTSLTAANNALTGGRIVFDVLSNGEVVIVSGDRTIRLNTSNGVIFSEAGGQSVIGGGTFDLKMIDANLGFITRWARSEIYRTTDGGRTWTEIPAFGGSDFFNWFEVEDENTFLIGNGRSSWRSTDAGQTWEQYSLFASTGRFFIGDDLYGMGRLTLSRSRDGGNSWENKFTVCTSPLDMVRRPGTNEIFLTYKNGIERLDLDEILSPVRQARPEAVSLKVVPNPTSGLVSVILPEEITGRGTADLFDLTGRRVSVPSNQENGQLRLDLSSLRPGCYLLRYATARGKLFQTRIIRN